MNDRGIVDKYEYIFDIYTKAYDFEGTAVKVLSAQDLLAFYESKSGGKAYRNAFDIYFLVEYFIQHHQDGHFILDECPFILCNGNSKIAQAKFKQTFYISKIT